MISDGIARAWLARHRIKQLAAWALRKYNEQKMASRRTGSSTILHATSRFPRLQSACYSIDQTITGRHPTLAGLCMSVLSPSLCERISRWIHHAHACHLPSLSPLHVPATAPRPQPTQARLLLLPLPCQARGLSPSQAPRTGRQTGQALLQRGTAQGLAPPAPCAAARLRPPNSSRRTPSLSGRGPRYHSYVSTIGMRLICHTRLHKHVACIKATRLYQRPLQSAFQCKLLVHGTE